MSSAPNRPQKVYSLRFYFAVLAILTLCAGICLTSLALYLAFQNPMLK